MNSQRTMCGKLSSAPALYESKNILRFNHMILVWTRCRQNLEHARLARLHKGQVCLEIDGFMHTTPAAALHNIFKLTTSNVKIISIRYLS